MTPDVADMACGFGPAAEELIDRIGAAARAGVHLVQIRQPGMDGRPLAALTSAAVAAVRGTRTRILVNDRFDVALAVGAHGVHLRGDSPPAPRIRAVAPGGFLIGRSVHALEEAQAAVGDGEVDYVMYGTVFATGSKPGAQPAGAERLAAVCAAVPIPVLAIGGITAVRLGAVAAAGADGFAAIGLFAGAPDRLHGIVERAMRAFDTLGSVP
jgi:thiamine-phosphate pyrophosphorylase